MDHRQGGSKDCLKAGGKHVVIERLGWESGVDGINGTLGMSGSFDALMSEALSCSMSKRRDAGRDDVGIRDFRDEREPVILIGGGGHALVVADAAIACGRGVVGFFDDAKDARASEQFGLTRLGTVETLIKLLAGRGGSEARRDVKYIMCVGDVKTRAKLLAKLEIGDRFATVVHPTAYVAESAVIGVGAFVGPRAAINACAIVGRHAIVNTGAIVEHDCIVGVNTHVAPGVVMGGDVEIGLSKDPEPRDGCLIGIGARILPGVKISPGCVVGAGAVVVKDVKRGVVKGVPAK